MVYPWRVMNNPAPVLFFGHGSPMNALGGSPFSDRWRAIGASLPRPRAVLCISAHWYTRGTLATAMAAPRTIYDFGGFPPELSAIRYPAPGNPALARRVRELLAPIPVGLDEREWGLDHGTWSVLVHVFPDADVPVVQLSLDRTLSGTDHLALARGLAPLRDEGVLVVGSGNIVHNLRRMNWDLGDGAGFDWAQRFDARVREHLEAGDDDTLANFEALGVDAEMSIPTPDHYLPLLYVLALRRPREAVSFPVEGYTGGSISMTSVRFG